MKSREEYLSTQKWFSKPRLICGVMSGTSLDGIDVALTRFNKSDKFEFELIKFRTYPFTKKLISNILSLISDKNNINLVSKLNFQLSYEYLKAIKSLINQSKISINDIDLISIHGQTVWHEPNCTIPNSLQIGNPAVISLNLGIPVVFDFRSADIIANGQGAPLVPIFDYHFLKSKNLDRIAINIGGISNLTYLPKNNSEIIAFDTGPGNVLIDFYTQKYYNKPYDQDGNYAKQGKTNQKLLKELLSIPYIKQKPPKSTGRELFNQSLISSILKKIKINEINPLDLINTLTKFTVKSIAINVENIAKKIDEIIVTGGGAKNKFMMELLKSELKYKIINSEKIGINPSAKEAIAFAFLAYLNIAQISGNIPSVTGAKKEVILGNISFPF